MLAGWLSYKYVILNFIHLYSLKTFKIILNLSCGVFNVLLNIFLSALFVCFENMSFKGVKFILQTQYLMQCIPKNTDCTVSNFGCK